MKFREHCDKLGTTFINGEVTNFKLEGKPAVLDDGSQYQESSGNRHRWSAQALNVEGKVNFPVWVFLIALLVTEPSLE